MELEERTSLRKSLSMWCAREAELLASMEKRGWSAAEWTRLYGALDELGILHVLFDADTRHDVDTVAEAASCLATHSPSLALLVVQQNLAACLLAGAGAARPRGWVALPLYDGAVEWSHQLRVRQSDRGYVVDGRWSSIPALPFVSSLLLPLASSEPADFALVEVRFERPRIGVARGAAVATLGLRGCPIGNLRCASASFDEGDVVARGAVARQSMESLWSQAEVLMLAIRAGIIERSYSVARDYAAVRWQGKKLIDEHSLVERMLADFYGVRCSLEESWRAMSAILIPDEPLTAGQLSTSAHLASELVRLASDGIQLLGGYGYMEDFGQERLFRDAKQCEMLLGHPQAKSFSRWRRESRREGA